ncbi:hypothetical protein GOB93_02300 [Acetobacter musti]|uniref:DUF551 domain-containing protein n=1 Tax=Acetobacter musti TaxID=864732 RepID=A0ABX0JJ42_9PROT|nr:hypothetical protein [Acetobacter musti]NHN83471.1 hypothetical protein [Acetobacter musti]
MPRRHDTRHLISQDQLEGAARAYYDYCDASWDDLDPKAQTHYRTRMQLALNAFVGHLWRPITSVPRDGSAVLLFHRMTGRGDYVWLDKWDVQDRQWRTAPRATPTHWMPVPPPPPG